MTPKVWHTKDPQKPIGTIYVGRPSIWGNPFVLSSESQRDDVIRHYEAWLTSNSELMAKLDTLEGKHLSCWCAPDVATPTCFLDSPIRRGIMPTPTLPPSFLKAGLVTPQQARAGWDGFKSLMMATEGRADSGKTEFLLSAPGPGAIICCDRGFDGAFNNETPPPSRRKDFGLFVAPMSTETQEQQDEYLKQWTTFRTKAYELVKIPELRTFCIDGDNISYDVQRLADHGKLAGVYPATKYGPTKAARRGFYNRLWDAKKIIITTNQMKEEWIDQVGPTGKVITESNGEAKQKPSGKFVAQGFPDQEYVWQIRIRHLFKPAWVTASGKEIPKQWGLVILKCKSNKDLEGQELWGEDCNFRSLVEYVFPHIPAKEWGYKD